MTSKLKRKPPSLTAYSKIKSGTSGLNLIHPKSHQPPALTPGASKRISAH